MKEPKPTQGDLRIVKTFEGYYQVEEFKSYPTVFWTYKLWDHASEPFSTMAQAEHFITKRLYKPRVVQEYRKAPTPKRRGWLTRLTEW